MIRRENERTQGERGEERALATNGNSLKGLLETRPAFTSSMSEGINSARSLRMVSNKPFEAREGGKSP